MKLKWFVLFPALVVGSLLLSRVHAADKPTETEEMRRERAKQVEERRRDERLGGALILPKPRMNAPPKAPKKP